MMKMIHVEYLSEMDGAFDRNRGEDPKYFAPKDMEMETGDIVLIERYDGAMTIGQVKNIHEDNNHPSNYSTTFNVLEVITDSCSTFRKKYNEIAKKRIKKQIEKRARELDKLNEYESYAKYDDEFKALLEDFKAKGGFSE